MLLRPSETADLSIASSHFTMRFVLLLLDHNILFSDILFLCRFKDHPTLNNRYLLLNLLGKGGFSEVYKVTIRDFRKIRQTSAHVTHWSEIVSVPVSECSERSNPTDAVDRMN